VTQVRKVGVLQWKVYQERARRATVMIAQGCTRLPSNDRSAATLERRDIEQVIARPVAARMPAFGMCQNQIWTRRRVRPYRQRTSAKNKRPKINGAPGSVKEKEMSFRSASGRRRAYHFTGYKKFWILRVSSVAPPWGTVNAID